MPKFTPRIEWKDLFYRSREDFTDPWQAALPFRRRCHENRAGSVLGENDQRLSCTAGAVEFGQVGLHPLVGAQRGQNGVKYGSGGDIREREDAVVHPLALASRRDDTCFPQIGQMPGDLRLAQAQNFDKVADADLVAGHQVQEAQPGGVGQRREETGQVERFRTATHK